MGLSEYGVHSFIVKLWLEEYDDTPNRHYLHGHITHVPSGQRGYLQNLEGIDDFIMHHLEELGVHFGKWWWVKHKLRRLKFYL